MRNRRRAKQVAGIVNYECPFCQTQVCIVNGLNWCANCGAGWYKKHNHIVFDTAHRKPQNAWARSIGKPKSTEPPSH